MGEHPGVVGIILFKILEPETLAERRVRLVFGSVLSAHQGAVFWLGRRRRDRKGCVGAYEYMGEVRGRKGEGSG